MSFESPEQAEKAMIDVRGFPLYSKSMVRLVAAFIADVADGKHVANLICEDSRRCGGAEAGRGPVRFPQSTEN